MKNKLIAFLAVSTTALSLSACMSAQSPTDLPPGKYEKKTSSTDAYGTTTKREMSTEVDRDAYGNKRAVVETETTEDPKGLFNKRTTKTKEVVREQN